MTVMPNRGKVVAVILALALAGGLLTLALLEKPAQAQAETTKFHFRSTFRQIIDSCTGEFPIQIQGHLHIIGYTTTDANGVRHIKLHFLHQGQGVGASGAKYVYQDVFNHHANVTGVAGDNFNMTITHSFSIIRQGSTTPTDDLDSRAVLHLTLNDQGVVTAAVTKVESECT